MTHALRRRRSQRAPVGRTGPSRPVDTLSRAVAHSDVPELRRAAAEALGRLGDPAALTALTAGMAAAERDVRDSCAAALLALGSEGREWLEFLAAAPGPAGQAARAALDAAAPLRA
jgi:HEAT repeat protein